MAAIVAQRHAPQTRALGRARVVARPPSISRRPESCRIHRQPDLTLSGDGPASTSTLAPVVMSTLAPAVIEEPPILPRLPPKAMDQRPQGALPRTQ